MTSSPSSPAPSDWQMQAVDTIDAVVGLVRDKATIPLRTVARGIVYGLAVVVVAVAMTVVVVVAAIRLLTVYLPIGRGPDGGHRVAAYLIVGGICALAGLFLLQKAESAAKRDARSVDGH